MKTTTENSTSQENSENLTISQKVANALATKTNRSARPMKSMVRARSLKPQRIEVGTKFRRKPIKA